MIVTNNYDILVARAVIESVCFQVCEIFEAMRKDSGSEPKKFLVDGGMTQSDVLLQLQSNLLGVEVHKPAIKEVIDSLVCTQSTVLKLFDCSVDCSGCRCCCGSDCRGLGPGQQDKRHQNLQSSDRWEGESEEDEQVEDGAGEKSGLGPGGHEYPGLKSGR